MSQNLIQSKLKKAINLKRNLIKPKQESWTAARGKTQDKEQKLKQTIQKLSVGWSVANVSKGSCPWSTFINNRQFQILPNIKIDQHINFSVNQNHPREKSPRQCKKLRRTQIFDCSLYDARVLATLGKIIVVTFNYRIGVLGNNNQLHQYQLAEDIIRF